MIETLTTEAPKAKAKAVKATEPKSPGDIKIQAPFEVVEGLKLLAKFGGERAVEKLKTNALRVIADALDKDEDVQEALKARAA